METVKKWFKDQAAIYRKSTKKNWAFFLVGNVLIGFGIAMMLLSALGTGPIDAATAGFAGLTPLTIGMWAILVSLALLAFASALGVHPMLGTVVAFFMVGFLIDVGMTVIPAATTVQTQWAQWLVGALLLAVGAGMTIASKLGASAYDQATLAINKYVKKLGLARLMLDAACAALAFAIGGPLGWGTLALMIIFPLVMPKSVQTFEKFLQNAPANG